MDFDGFIGTLEQWSNWSTCNTTCGYGAMNRTRGCCVRNGDQSDICSSDNLTWKDCLCDQSNYGAKSFPCLFTKPTSYISMEDILIWKNCLCNPTKSSTRSLNCLFAEFTSCNISNEGNWNNWSPWSTCYNQDSSKFMNRSRSCNKTCAGCVGKDTEVIRCLSVDSSWGKWSSWSSCNISYSYGFMNRTRDCNVSNVEHCLGNSTEVKMCFENKTCEASCGKWSSWSSCNVSYGYGFMNRTRDCNVSNDVEQCFGNGTEVKECFENKTCEDVCTQWSIWSQCNVSCGDGFANRTRICNTTKNFGWCSSNLTDFRHCVETTTRKGVWATWSECSVTCGIGNRSSIFLSEKATNVGMRVEYCTTTNCPVDGMWGEWVDLGCSKTCDGGMKTLKRSCDNPSPANFGRNCMGFSNYTLTCDNEQICPVKGSWSMWSPWSSCSQPCLGGKQFRVRDCSNPTPKYNGLFCQGISKQIVDCPIRQNCKNVAVNLNLYIDQYSLLTDDSSQALKEKIRIAIKNFYESHKRNVTFDIVLHSVKQP